MPNLNTQILGLTPANADMDDLEVGRRSKWGGGHGGPVQPCIMATC